MSVGGGLAGCINWKPAQVLDRSIAIRAVVIAMAGITGTVSILFFGKPTAVSEMRKIDVGIGLQF